MKAKKLIALTLTGAMAIASMAALVACGGDDTPAEDTNVYYVVGRDKKSDVLNENNWTAGKIIDGLTFKKVADSEQANVFSVTFDAYAGNADAGYSFKFLYKTSADEVISDDDLWARQMGIEYLPGYDEEDKVVKKDGETIFTTGGGMNEHNIAVAKGHDGKYKFTIQTFPGEDKAPVITWELVQAIEVTHDMYLYGDINSFGFGKLADAFAMNEIVNGDVVTWQTSFSITKEDLFRTATGAYTANADDEANGSFAAVQVYNKVDKRTYVLDDETYTVVELEDDDATGEYMLLPEGKYTITYAQADNSIEITAGTHQMFFIGSFNEWGRADADYALIEAGNGVWTGKITLEAAAEVQLFNALATNDSAAFKPGFNMNLEAGTHFFTYFEEGDKVSHFKAESYILVGTFIDEQGNNVNFFDAGVRPDIMPVLTETEEGSGVYSGEIVVTDVTEQFSWVAGNGGVFAIQVVYLKDNGDTNDGREWKGYNSGNYYFTEPGTYVVTYDSNAGAENSGYTVTPKE